MSSAKSAVRKKEAPRNLSSDQLNEIQEAFELFDSDKDGSINYHEFKVAMSALGFMKTKSETQQIMQKYDKEATDVISLETFTEIMKELILAQDPKEEVLKAFQLFDSDETGKISFKNLKQVARELGDEISEDELRAMIAEFDKDHDGEISQQEFLDIIMGSTNDI
ncbi:centrin-3-like [Symsagittifera roscoffensis]|uniref:centrin-3-like n=1 Tax=Symsagittifera roscoffensis TaxID=84072 RepID=UPI00307C1A1B